MIQYILNILNLHCKQLFELADQVNVLKCLRTLTCLTIQTKCGIRPMPCHKKICLCLLSTEQMGGLWKVHQLFYPHEGSVTIWAKLCSYLKKIPTGGL